MTSFRPRPIDINRSLPIILEELDQDTSSPCSDPEEVVNVAEAEEKNLCIPKEENGQSIPIPKVLRLEPDSPQRKSFSRPDEYIQYSDELETVTNYDLDTDDELLIQSINSKYKRKILSLDRFESMIDLFEKEAANIGTIPPFSQVEGLIDPGKLPSSTVLRIYNYWADRHLKGKYTGRYLRPPDPGDTSPWLAFRPRIEGHKRKRKRESTLPLEYLKMRQLRQELERARTLLEMIKRREKLKREKVRILEKIFHLKTFELKQPRYNFRMKFRPLPIQVNGFRPFGSS